MSRALLVAMIGLAGCVGEFPAAPAPPLLLGDSGARDAASPPDAGEDDPAAPTDLGPAVDLAGGCPPLTASAPAVRLQGWNGEVEDVPRIDVGGGCPPLRLEVDARWLEAELEAGQLVLRPRLDGLSAGLRATDVVLRDAAGNGRRIPVTLEHFAAPIGPGEPKALVFAVGGLPGAATVAPTPAIAWLAERGLTALDAGPPPGAATSEAAGWASMLTGVSPDRHGVVDAPMGPTVPTFPGRLDRVGRPVVFAAQWPPLTEALVESELDTIDGDRDAVREAVLNKLGASTADLFLIALDDPARLIREGGRNSQAFTGALGAVDADLQALLQAILRRATVAEEDWLIVVVGQPLPGDPPETSLLLAARPGVAPRALPEATALDVAPTVLRHLGLEIEAGWGLEGAPLGAPAESLCANGIDDDGDGRMDCRDPDCADRCALACVAVDGGSELGRVAQGDTTGRADAEGTCGGGRQPDLAVFWTAPATDTYLFHADGSALDTLLHIRRNDCQGSELACSARLYDRELPRGVDPGGAWLPVEAGHSVVAFVDGDFGSRPGPVQLNVFGFGAECRRARPLGAVEGVVAEGDNRGAATRIPPRLGEGGDGGCDRRINGAADVLLRWEAPRDGTWRFHTRGSRIDTILRIFRDQCQAPDFVACHDDLGGVGPDQYASSIDLRARGGASALIVLSGFWQSGGEWQGDYRLSIERIGEFE